MRPISIATLVTAAVAWLATAAPTQGEASSYTDDGGFDYSQALDMNFFYYEAARSGKLANSTRVDWRGDSNVEDATQDGKHDLSGGYHDAGDHLKITMPLAVTLSQIGWGMIEFKDELKASGHWEQALATMQWGLDWLLKAAYDKSRLVVQVGSGKLDHAYWGPPERMDMSRPVLTASPDKPAADVASDVAAALAIGSIIFDDEGDEEYSTELLKSSTRMYKFAIKNLGKAAEWMPEYDAKLYNSSHYEDDMMWAAVWLYKATGDESYYRDARSLWGTSTDFARYWPVWNWDNMYWGALVLLQRIEARDMDAEPDPEYQSQIDSFFDSWMDGDVKAGIKYTPEGLACIDMWGVMRNTINAASLAFLWSNAFPTEEKARSYRCWAQSQIDFALGNNSRNQSYVVGWGTDFPTQPHFRAAACADWEDEDVECDKDNFDADEPSPHVLKGAMVFGQCSTSFKDERPNPETNEVALDGNAGLAVSLAALTGDHQCDGEPFIPPDKRSPDAEKQDNGAPPAAAGAAGFAVLLGSALLLNVL